MRFSTLQEWLAWQETLHPSEIDLKLERIVQVLRRMALQSPSYTVITVAGTNGKGSSVAMLEAMLRAAGYRVGAYTSPHLLRYNERIRINGGAADDDAICESFERIDQLRGDISLTYFEFGTLAAIDLFARAKLDIVVLEVGLGGRLDAVNILDADVALITPIDIDHVKWLGDNRNSIALEKAGILRAGRPAVCTDRDPPASLLRRVQELQVPLSRLGVDFDFEAGNIDWHWRGPREQRLTLPRPSLSGEFQLINAAGVMMVLDHLRHRFPVKHEAVVAGLQHIALDGRFQALAQRPAVIVDVAHNPQSARSLVDNLVAQTCAGKTHAVIAMLGDKDIQSVVNSLRPVIDYWYIAALDNPRAAPVSVLRDLLQDVQPTVCDDVLQAYAAARAAATADDRIIVTGSFYTVSAVLGNFAAAQGVTL